MHDRNHIEYNIHLTIKRKIVMRVSAIELMY